MKRIAVVSVILIAVACSSETYDPLGLITQPGDLSGTWIGVAPHGAQFVDNPASPNCSYEADMVLELQEDGSALNGTIQLTIRNFFGPQTDPPVPCTAVGTVTTQALSGTRSATQATFTLEDGVTVFTATYAADVLEGELAETGGARGTWRVVR